MKVFNRNTIRTVKHSLKSKEGKTLASNFSYLFLLQIASYIFPLITLPYLARVTGAYGMGKVAFATAIMSWVQTICDWGFSFTATRDVAKYRENKERVSNILSDVTWARFFLSALSFLVNTTKWSSEKRATGECSKAYIIRWPIALRKLFPFSKPFFSL